MSDENEQSHVQYQFRILNTEKHILDNIYRTPRHPPTFLAVIFFLFPNLDGTPKIASSILIIVSCKAIPFQLTPLHITTHVNPFLGHRAARKPQVSTLDTASTIPERIQSLVLYTESQVNSFLSRGGVGYS